MAQEKIIEFNASRIMKGNPVKGILISENEDWIRIKLLKDIEGIVNVWYEGEEKEFRKCLINGEIKQV